MGYAALTHPTFNSIHPLTMHLYQSQYGKAPIVNKSLAKNKFYRGVAKRPCLDINRGSSSLHLAMHRIQRFLI